MDDEVVIELRPDLDGQALFGVDDEFAKRHRQMVRIDEGLALEVEGWHALLDAVEDSDGQVLAITRLRTGQA